MFNKSNNKPFLIAGPCSAETPEQVLDIAGQLAPLGIDFFRAGIWKPRTRPGAFEGMGAQALPWLQEVKAETGIKIAVEVANGNHVDEALKHEVDLLWIGARTTVNPFAVQEIADALKGIDVPVLVKNPVNPDLELWIGALERILNCGITALGAIHRGFSTYVKSSFRNAPYWELPIELKRLMPNLPMICDNSHICGNREDLAEVAQQALDLQYDGIMTEVHCNPDQAWSDARQQVTPNRYSEILQSLIIRRNATDNAVFRDSLEAIRHKIDEIDLEMLNMLSRRMHLVEDIGRIKQANNISILQTGRWNEILERGFQQGRERNLSEDFVKRFLSVVHQESIARQKLVMRRGIK